MKKGLVQTGCCLLAVSSVFADTHYVSPDGADIPPYTSLYSAARSIQNAINQADKGDTVLVAPGVYRISRQVNVDVEITLQSTGGREKTVIDGQNTTRCVYLGKQNAVLAGFTLRNGYVSDPGIGGGAYCLPGTVVRDCIIRNCVAHDAGGAYLGDGAGMENTIVTGNAAWNTSGVLLDEPSKSANYLRGCLVTGNARAEGGCGVVYCTAGFDWYRWPSMLLPVIENCTIVSNNGDAVDAHAAGPMFAPYAMIRNSILDVVGLNCCYEYSLSPSALPGPGNVIGDPKFVDPANGDFRLQPDSPCIDAGTNQYWMAIAADLYGNDRLSHGNVDIGAYELPEDAFPRTFHVARTGSRPFPPYASWAFAATNIHDVLPMIRDRDTILVGAGRYDLPAQITLSNAVRLIAVGDIGDTILDGGGRTRCLYLSHSNALASGFLIENGAALGGDTLTGSGGGVFIAQRGTVSNCIVSGCSAAQYGGGIYMDRGGDAGRCILADNAAAHGGGAACNQGGVLLNCTIVTNAAAVKGGGIYCFAGGTVSNSIVSHNRSPSGENWCNDLGGDQYSFVCTMPMVGGVSNIDADPEFADPDGRDFHLKSTGGRWEPASGAWVCDATSSPCIDRGDPNVPCDAEPKPNGGRMNLGFYANTSEASRSPLVDSDTDGMDDSWETNFFGNLGHNGTLDSDGDGLSDLEEYQYAANPLSGDSDGDQMPDKWEILHGTKPFADDAAADADHDGLSNLGEFQNGCDLTLADSDGDSLYDGWEVAFGANPTTAVFSLPLSECAEIGGFAFGSSAPMLDIEACSQRVYCARQSEGLEILDVADPTNCVRLGGFQGPVATALAVSNRTVYLATVDISLGRQLRIINSSNPAACQALGTHNIGLGEPVRSVFMSGRYAYLAMGADGLEVVKVDDPAHCVRAARVGGLGDATDVYVTANRAYVAAGTNGLKIVDVTNPSNSFLIGSVALAAEARAVQVVGTNAYVACGSTMKVLDVSDPTNCVLLSDSGAAAWDAEIAWEFAYTAGSSNGMGVVDIRDPNACTSAAWCALGGSVSHVALEGDLCFLSGDENNLHVVQLSTDVDQDGMRDQWERGWWGDLDRDGAGDFDGDGVSDLGEFLAGIDPTCQDTDADLLTDGEEIAGTTGFLTDPAKRDTDGDDVGDGDELLIGRDPLDGGYGSCRPIRPTGAITNRRPEFTWTTVPDAEWYYIWINKDGATFYKGWIQGRNYWSPSNDLPCGEYVWWVRCWLGGTYGRWSAPMEFSIPRQLPGATRLLCPSGAILTSRPTFRWDSVAYATMYQVEIKRDNALYLAYWLYAATNYTPTAAMPYGRYSWRVQTWGPDGYGPWSATSNFIYGACDGLAPTGAIENRKPQFAWTEIPDVEWYRLWLARNGVKYVDCWVPSTNWTPVTDLPAGYYSWWVSCWDQAGSGPWSDEKNFSIAVHIPDATTPRSPIGEISANPPSFAWDAVEYSTWYRLEIKRNDAGYLDAWVEDSTNYLPIAPLTYGSYSWRVRTWSVDGYGPWSGSANFQFGMCQQLQPSGTVTERLPALTWNCAENAPWYYVWINKNGTVFARQWTVTSSWAPSAALTSGEYQWWVRSWNAGAYGPWSTSVTFRIAQHVPDAAALLEPLGVEADERPTFKWSAVDDATWYYLWVERNGSASFKNWIEGNTSHVPVAALQFGDYKWWVRTWGPDGYGPWSSQGDFTRGLCDLLSPTGIVTGTTQPVFNWDPVPGATWYYIRVTTNDRSYHEQWLEENTWTPSGPMPAGDYEWEVRAWNAAGTGPWSAEENFTIQP